MRNLQKILALALALMMSFSLVVTANAAFSDDADINETYSESVNVLAQLEVFKGYNDGSYQPKADITRAEVAAIIYRIATGDVTDSQVSLYSDWNRFKDVSSESWYAGYVNYCANAEYIKGYGDGNFRPQQNVTGYEALAMILRAVGYGKMDEFVGSDWAVNTAARANTLKISRNVTAALLGSPASREVVAELLFRSILVPTVSYTQLNGYTENDKSLGEQSLGLQRIEGVVVANEWANLYDTQVLAEGKTDLEVAEGDVRRLDYPTAVTDIGESRYAYVRETGKNSITEVFALVDSGLNQVWDNTTGAKTDIDTDAKFKKATGDLALSRTDDTEYYVNFGREGHFSCDQRLEMTVTFYSSEADDKFPFDVSEYAYECNHDKDDTNDWTVEYVELDANGEEIKSTNDVKVNAAKTDYVYQGGILQEDKDDPTLITGYAGTRYNRIIRAKQEITQEEMDILEGIFAAADNVVGNGLARDQVTGDVYLGTKSTIDRDAKERDISNEISFRKFKDEYINSEAWDQNIDGSDNGEWLKIVDNDNDGKADYVFLTEYTLDKVIGSYTKSGETILEFNSLDVEDYEDNDGIVVIPEDIAVDDVVLWTEIDKKIVMAKAEKANASIKTVNFKDETCTTTEDTTYGQSGIENETKLDERVVNMDDQVEYILYFDAYGYVRAYELAQGNKYGLLTEMYFSRGQNGQYVTNAELTAELKKGAEKLDEFSVANKDKNDFLLDTDGETKYDEYWSELHSDSKDGKVAGYENVYSVPKNTEIVLQPAIGELAHETGHKWAFGRTVNDIFTNATTNVAVYLETGDGEVRLSSPVKLATDERGEQLYYATTDTTGGKYLEGEKNDKDQPALIGQPAYEVDFIELDSDQAIAADAQRYDIDADNRYYASSYVNATHNTEYYIVDKQNGKVNYFTDYTNVSAIDAGDIVAAYALAHNVEFDSNKNDYWVADVIVIEVRNIKPIYDSVSLAFYNPYQNSGSVKTLNTLNTESEKALLNVIPTDKDWGRQWHGEWFYEVDEDKMDGEDLLADTIRVIEENYNDYGIYAGKIFRVYDIRANGGYIDVIKTPKEYDATSKEKVTGIKVDSSTELFAIGAGSNGTGSVVSAREINMTESDKTNDFQTGDRIIWAVDKDGDVAFVVNVSYVDGKWAAPGWLKNMGPASDAGLWYDIVDDQNKPAAADPYDEAVKAYTALKSDATDEEIQKVLDLVNAALAKNPTGTKKSNLDSMKANLEDRLEAVTGTPEMIARKLVQAKNAHKAAHSASTYTDKDADPAVVAAAEALRKAATAYKGLSGDQLTALNTAFGSLKTAADAIATNTDGDYDTVGPVLQNAKAILAAVANDKNTLDDAEKALKNITEAEKALAVKFTSTFAKDSANAQKLVDNSKAVRAAMEAIKTAKDMEDSEEYTEAEIAPYKQAAVDAYQKLTSSQRTALNGMGWNVDSAEVNDSSELQTAVTGWIATIPVDAEIKSVKLKDTLKTLKIEQDSDGDYIISNIPADTTLTGLIIGNWVVVEKTGDPATWAADNTAVNDYDATYVITVPGTAGGEAATVNVYFVLNEAPANAEEKQAEADVLKNEIKNVKTTTNAATGYVERASLEIGGEDTSVTTNVDSFNDVYQTDDGTPLFEGVTSKDVVAMVMDLTEYVTFNAEKYQIKQVNKALNTGYAPGTFPNDTKTKGDYVLSDMREFAFLLMNGEDVEFTVTAWGGTDYDGPSVVIMIKNNVTVVKMPS